MRREEAQRRLRKRQVAPRSVFHMNSERGEQEGGLHMWAMARMRVLTVLLGESTPPVPAEWHSLLTVPLTAPLKPSQKAHCYAISLHQAPLGETVCCVPPPLHPAKQGEECILNHSQVLPLPLGTWEGGSWTLLEHKLSPPLLLLG